MNEKTGAEDVRFSIAKLAHITKEERRVEVAFDIGLFKRLDFARKDVLDFEVEAMLVENSLLDQFKGEKGGLCSRAHCRDA